MTELDNPPFPQELFDSFIEQAEGDLRTLFQLCLVSRAFLHEARKHLYRHIVIARDKDLGRYARERVSAIDHSHQFALYETLTTLNPQLALLVRSFLLHVQKGSVDGLLPATLSASFTKMDNLKELTIHFRSDKELLPMTTLFEGAKFQLKTLNWFGKECGHGHGSNDPTVLQFLATQPEISTLALPTWKPAAISPTVCPRLQRLQRLNGKTRLVLNLLPQRHEITKLKWHMEDKLLRVPSLNAVSSQLSNLRFLHLEGTKTDKRLSFHLFSPHLARLETLYLSGRAGNVCLDGELRSITSIPHLRKFTYSIPPVIQLNFSRGTQEKFASRWFSKMEHLQEANFRFQFPVEGSPEIVRRWTRSEYMASRSLGISMVAWKDRNPDRKWSSFQLQAQGPNGVAYRTVSL
ncbi:hypothetical protein NP233_g8696 [Leucocoprinus birnbaumii]|uniref:Uncharacterized protein n=1 Tax=Leucocoprinus birnbaumii TaxID=56174 RepID=A0AAD5YNU4_9AGAR|nr:hypothetical protein NP233_g8696 [Leucocoprinus birnbaumii]